MPSMSDAARMMAASDGAGMDMGPAPDPGQVDTVTNGDQQGSPDDLAAGLDMIEGALSSMPEELQEKARTHIEALRSIAEDAKSAETPGTATPPKAIPEGEEQAPTPGPGERGELG